MKDINELAKKLADLYGIEYVNAPVGHVVVGSDGIERPMETYNFMEIFGLGQRLVAGWDIDMASLPCVLSCNEFFENPARTIAPSRYFVAGEKSRQDATRNGLYAIAA